MAKKTVSHQAFSKTEAIRFGWQIAKKNFWFFVAIILIPYGISWLFSFISNPLVTNANGFNRFVGILIMIISWIVGVETCFATMALYFKFADKKKASLRDLFAYFDAGLLFRYFLVTILYSLMVCLGFLLFIFPGIYFSVKFLFAPYIYVDKRLGVIESFKLSAKLTEGVKWQLFLLGLLQSLVCLLGALALLVGLFVAIPINYLSDIYVYRKLLAKE